MADVLPLSHSGANVWPTVGEGCRRENMTPLFNLPLGAITRGDKPTALPQRNLLRQLDMVATSSIKVRRSRAAKSKLRCWLQGSWASSLVLAWAFKAPARRCGPGKLTSRPSCRAAAG